VVAHDDATRSELGRLPRGGIGLFTGLILMEMVASEWDNLDLHAVDGSGSNSRSGVCIHGKRVAVCVDNRDTGCGNT
jgi:hypothetical protein